MARTGVVAKVRAAVALVAGAALAVLGALTLGEYPLSPVVVWIAALVVPALLGVVTSSLSGRKLLPWITAGPVAGAAIAWGVAISSSWGIEPVPLDAWVAAGAGGLWPVAWGLLAFNGSPARRFRPRQRGQGW